MKPEDGVGIRDTSSKIGVMRRIAKLGPLLPLLAGAGLQVSPLQSWPLAIVLWLLAGGLALAVYWPRVRELRIRWPLYLQTGQIQEVKDSEPPTFEPQSIYRRLSGLQLVGLWTPDGWAVSSDPYIEFTLQLEFWDNNVRVIIFDKIEGKVKWGNEECNSAAVLTMQEVRLQAGAPSNLRIRQPITTRMADRTVQELQNDNGKISCVLGLKLVGKIEMTVGSMEPLRCPLSITEFGVLGPLSVKSDAARMVALQTTFVSAAWRNNWGELIQKSE